MSCDRMLKTCRALRERLSSPAGETIVETLVSVLISALSLLLLSVAVASAVNIVSTSRYRMGNYYEAESSMAREAHAATSPDDDDTSKVLSTVPLEVTKTGSTRKLVSEVSVDVYETGDGVALYQPAGGTP